MDWTWNQHDVRILVTMQLVGEQHIGSEGPTLNSGYPSTSASGLALPCQYLSGQWLQR